MLYRLVRAIYWTGLVAAALCVIVAVAMVLGAGVLHGNWGDAAVMAGLFLATGFGAWLIGLVAFYVLARN